jgi:hypothetical protein
MGNNVEERIHYSIKGVISQRNDDAYTVPNTPLFKTEEEAINFYERNKDCESPYNWKKWRKIAVYKMTVSEEICRYM